MRHLRAISTCLLLATIWLSSASASVAGDHAFQLIVHPDNAVTSLSRDFVRDAFLKKASRWPGGGAIRPVDLPRSLAARKSFSEEVLRKSLVQLRSYWSQRIFSGTGVPPPEAESASAAVAYVLANPGAVAYLPLGTDVGRAKVISLK